MQNRNFDSLEQRIAEQVAAKAGSDPLTIEPAELPAFISWAVKEFADTIRKEVETGGAPF